MSTTLTQDIHGLMQTGPERISVARDAVNTPMIHHLSDAMNDRNPLYLDPELARAAGHPDVVAPPSALQVWNMINPGEPDNPSAVDRAYQALEEAGFTKVVAVNCDQTYDRYLVPGDVITSTETIETLSEPKQTALGEGYFITTLTTFRDQHGETVGTMRFRTLWYSPAQPAEETTND